jgi:hypothetical protein
MKNEELDVLINQSLKREPGFRLPDDFALKMTGVIIRRQQWKTDIREYLSVLAIVILLLAIAGGTYYYANKVVFMKIVEFTSQNLITVILTILVLNFVFFADRVLLPLMFNRWSKS